MYAVIESGGRQYKVEKGDVIDVQLLGEAALSKGKTKTSVKFDRVLLVAGE